MLDCSIGQDDRVQGLFGIHEKSYGIYLFIQAAIILAGLSVAVLKGMY